MIPTTQGELHEAFAQVISRGDVLEFYQRVAIESLLEHMDPEEIEEEHALRSISERHHRRFKQRLKEICAAIGRDYEADGRYRKNGGRHA